jgi:hypothetical protein
MDSVTVMRVVSDGASETRAFRSDVKAMECAREIIETEMEWFEASKEETEGAIRQLKSLGRYSHDQFVITLVELEVE